MLKQIPKVICCVSTFILVKNADIIRTVSQKLYHDNLSDKSIASSLLFKIENGMVVVNPQLKDVFKNNQDITIHNDNLPRSIFRQLSIDHKFKISFKGKICVSENGDIQSTWKSIQFLNPSIQQGNLLDIVAQNYKNDTINQYNTFLIPEIQTSNNITQKFKSWIK
ncbi:hypothetical protein SS50377_20637 [Spironucleus salmonicida]|nr:hypothetical protein SS50377_20637 [Spironucleus salmonicida]